MVSVPTPAALVTHDWTENPTGVAPTNGPFIVAAMAPPAQEPVTMAPGTAMPDIALHILSE